MKFELNERVRLPEKLGGAIGIVRYFPSSGRIGVDVPGLYATVYIASEDLTKAIPPEPSEIGYIHESSKFPGQRYVRIDLGANAGLNRWYRITYTPYGQHAPIRTRWENIA